VEQLVVTVSLRAAVFLAAVVTTVGCYNTPTINPHPGPWLIDDFEGGNGYPVAPAFEHWECRPKDDSHPIAACEVTSDPSPESNLDPGSKGSKVLHLRSRLWPNASSDEFTRSEVTTFAKSPQDLTPYATIGLNALLKPDSPTATPLLKVQLSCTGVRAAKGSVSPNPAVLMTVLDPPSGSYGSWQSYNPSLAKFTPPEDLPLTQRVAPDECLARVDAIKITVDSKSKYTGDFHLYVDDIEFIPRQ
jgi:hypothetical protein